MKKNVGSIDRLIRIVIALFIVSLFISNTVSMGSAYGIILLVVAVIFGGTATASACPLYSILGISTCWIDTTK